MTIWAVMHISITHGFELGFSPWPARAQRVAMGSPARARIWYLDQLQPGVTAAADFKYKPRSDLSGSLVPGPSPRYRADRLYQYKLK
jgi:hypothetical protein